MLILLDIDGVMIPAAGWRKVELLEDGFPKFSTRAVHHLNQILRATGASIVLTSSHKSRFSSQQWERIFSLRGIEASIQKLNDNSANLNRRDEILNWIKQKPSSQTFVIIDDDKCLNDLPAELKSSLILTKSLVGLDTDATERALGILKTALV